jgi:hypothetical protein
MENLVIFFESVKELNRDSSENECLAPSQCMLGPTWLTFLSSNG